MRRCSPLSSLSSLSSQELADALLHCARRDADAAEAEATAAATAKARAAGGAAASESGGKGGGDSSGGGCGWARAVGTCRRLEAAVIGSLAVAHFKVDMVRRGGAALLQVKRGCLGSQLKLRVW